MSILAYQYPVFKPAMRIVTNITNASMAQVTTSFNHNYMSGLIIRLVVPIGYGMIQANQLFGSIIVTGDTTFNISVDTSLFSPFVTPEAQLQYCQCIPFAEDNNSTYQAYQNVLPY